MPDALIHIGQPLACTLPMADIVLKADASEAGPGCRDSQIAAVPETSIDGVARIHQGLAGNVSRPH